MINGQIISFSVNIFDSLILFVLRSSTVKYSAGSKTIRNLTWVEMTNKLFFRVNFYRIDQKTKNSFYFETMSYKVYKSRFEFTPKCLNPIIHHKKPGLRLGIYNHKLLHVFKIVTHSQWTTWTTCLLSSHRGIHQHDSTTHSTNRYDDAMSPNAAHLGGPASHISISSPTCHNSHISIQTIRCILLLCPSTYLHQCHCFCKDPHCLFYRKHFLSLKLVTKQLIAVALFGLD